MTAMRNRLDKFSRQKWEIAGLIMKDEVEKLRKKKTNFSAHFMNILITRQKNTTILQKIILLKILANADEMAPALIQLWAPKMEKWGRWHWKHDNTTWYGVAGQKLRLHIVLHRLVHNKEDPTNEDLKNSWLSPLQKNSWKANRSKII